MSSNPQNYYLEIEGHTDSRGSTATNERLGLQRAEAVKRYLYEQHNVPLHKMNVISFGETKPAAPNTNRTNRATNRRVVDQGAGVGVKGGDLRPWQSLVHAMRHRGTPARG